MNDRQDELMVIISLASFDKSTTSNCQNSSIAEKQSQGVFRKFLYSALCKV